MCQRKEKGNQNESQCTIAAIREKLVEAQCGKGEKEMK